MADSDHNAINAAEATHVEFSVSGLAAGESGTVTFTDSANQEVTATITGDGVYSADLSGLADGAVTSSITTINGAGHSSTVSGNMVSLDTDKDLNPALVVDATDPSHVTIAISGFEGDEKGTITFTDSTGHQDVVNVGSNGNYTADLSSLAPGKMTYLLTETDPAGNTISIDPPTILGGDGSTGAPAGIPQLSHLLDGYAARPSWQVAGVDYAVGVQPGTALKIPTANNLPPGASLQHGAGWTAVYVDGNNVKLDGYDLTGLTVMINDDATGTVTISNCEATTGVNIRSTVGATANLVVQNCSLDGGGAAADPDFQLIKVWCPLTVEYSLIANAPGGIYSSASLTAVYNVLEGFGVNGGHANAIYVTGGNDPNASTLIAYNTLYSEGTRTSSYPVTGLGAAIAFFGDGGNFYSSTVANNTIVSALPSAASYLIGYYPGSGTATGGNVYDNYVASVNGFNNPNSGAFGTFYPNSSSVQATYASNIDMSNGKTIAADNSETATTSTSTPPPTSTPAPVISSFSPDTGVVGDGITHSNTLTLTGTATPSSTVNVYDNGTKIGTATVNSSGSWDYITAVLTDAKHVLTATDTKSGQTSAASAPLTVTVDTHVPGAPVLGSDTVVNTNHVQLSGTAEANSTIMVYDGSTVVGTGTASSTGTFTITTSALSNGPQPLTATATDAAGTVSAASQPLDPVIPVSTPTPPAVPTIASFSPDTGVVGDHTTNDNTPTLTGTAVANSTVDVFDGKTEIGTAAVDASGHWSLTTPVLSDGTHSLTATDVSSGQTSAASTAFSVTIDTHVPVAPTMAVYSQSGSAVGSSTTVTDLVLKGSAEAGSTIDIFDSGKQIGTVTTSSGSWSFDTGSLANGSHSFTATAIDAAGTSSHASAADVVSVTSPISTPPPPAAKSIEFTGVSYAPWNDTATIKGTADAYSQVKLYDGTTLIGTVTASSKGTWSLTDSNLSDTLHTITAQEVNSSGHVVATSSGSAMLMASNTSTLTGTGGDDFMYSSSSTLNDTFVFAANFGHSTIQGFTATGSGHDTVQFSKNVFDSFASVLSHATQVGQDVVIAAGNDTLKLLNTKLSALNSQDFHFA